MSNPALESDVEEATRSTTLVGSSSKHLKETISFVISPNLSIPTGAESIKPTSSSTTTALIMNFFTKNEIKRKRNVYGPFYPATWESRLLYRLIELQ